MVKTKGPGTKSIAINKKAKFEYELEERFEAGLVLEGWEVKALRDKHIQLSESYVLLKNGEAYIIGMHISPLNTVSTHITPDPTRTRKLLLHKRELSKLIGSVDRKGFTLVPTALYWKRGKVKIEIALAKGKKTHDKRATEKKRDWAREKEKIMKSRK